jgi:hypothetical protein
MRSLWICLLLLAVMPARAEEKSEVIPLRYLPAGELERALIPRDAVGTLHIPLPAGLLAWTVDARQNALTVAGSEAAIQELKTIIRLLDVPPIHVRLAVRRLRADDPAIAALKIPPLAAPEANAPSTARAVLLNAEQIAVLEGRPVVASATLDTNNNRPVHINETGPRRQPLSLVTVVPRVNGDNTVTLLVSMSESLRKPEAAASTAPSPVTVVGRVPEGSAILVLAATSETLLMVRVRAVSTPTEAPPGRE